MKLPRDMSGRQLVALLERHGYRNVRQTGSHIRLVGFVKGIEHHVTIPAHKQLKIGILNGIVSDVAARSELIARSSQNVCFEIKSEPGAAGHPARSGTSHASIHGSLRGRYFTLRPRWRTAEPARCGGSGNRLPTASSRPRLMGAGTAHCAAAVLARAAQ
ncbi:MAG: type II toxin-antitoxin system HicA family toxin [Acidobacteria bacterium]|nr:type II toxin-antitoxin system HicA family toxin [Acidobacteriota bacterium]